MTKYNVPKRVYSDGAKRLVSFRLPEKLLQELELLAKEKGWTLTDVLTTVLDQYIQWERKE